MVVEVAAIAADYMMQSSRLLMNTARKLGPHSQTDRGTCPGVGILIYYKSRYTTVHPCIGKFFFYIVYLNPEMKSFASNCMPEVVSNLSYDLEKMLVSCPQVASYCSLCDSLIFLGVLVRVTSLSNNCIVSDHTCEARNVKYCSELNARSGFGFIIRPQKDA
jgi:hypothetical protein